LRSLMIEMLAPDGWRVVAVLDEDMPAGSISNNASGHREVIRFHWVGNHALIERSLAGADTTIETPEGPLRAITTAGFEILAHLLPGEEFEMPVMTDGMTRVEKTRFRYAGR